MQFSHYELSIYMYVCMYMYVTRVTPREQELPTLPEHLSSPSVLSGVRVCRSLVLCVVFCRSLFILCHFRHCISFLALRLLIALWYLLIFYI